jgi:hypothetical protein
LQWSDWAGGVSILGVIDIYVLPPTNTSEFVLGLGDIVLPGFLVALAARADAVVRTGQAQCFIVPNSQLNSFG